MHSLIDKNKIERTKKKDCELKLFTIIKATNSWILCLFYYNTIYTRCFLFSNCCMLLLKQIFIIGKFY